MLWECKDGCKLDQPKSEGHPGTCPTHGRIYVYPKALGSNGRKPLRRVSEKRQGEVRRRGSTLKRGKGFAASKAQQDKVRGLPCVVCGRDGYEAQVDPAHVYPRRLAPCDCADGVVPLCRDCHARYEDPNQPFDLLPALITCGYRAELVHAVVAHEAPLLHLLEQVTGCEWMPSPKREEAALTAASERSTS